MYQSPDEIGGIVVSPKIDDYTFSTDICTWTASPHMLASEGLVYLYPQSPEPDVASVLRSTGLTVSVLTGPDAPEETEGNQPPLALILVTRSLATSDLDIIGHWATRFPGSYYAAICQDSQPALREVFFEFGGHDIIGTDHYAVELLAKINTLRALRHQIQRCQTQIDEASEMALTAMAASADLGLVIEFLKNTFDIEDYDGIAAYLISSLSVYSDHIGILVDGTDGIRFFSSADDRNQYREQLLAHRDQGRLVTATNAEGNCASIQINQRHISVVVDQIEADGTQLGRIKDTLQMLLESAELCATNVLHALQAKRAMEARTLFLSTMSHELRTPLNAIQGFISLLARKQVGDTVTERDANALMSIQRNAINLTQMVNTTLDVAAACAGKLELTLSGFTVNDLLESVRKRQEYYARERLVEMQVCSLTQDQTLFADRERIRETLNQLVNNAIKFNRPKGTVVVQANVYEDDVIGPCLRVLVKDTGLGISHAHQDQLLYTFGQIEESLDRQYQGIGLGLRFAYLILQKHGGVLQFSSVELEGSQFEMLLPLRSA